MYTEFLQVYILIYNFQSFSKKINLNKTKSMYYYGSYTNSFSNFTFLETSGMIVNWFSPSTLEQKTIRGVRKLKNKNGF